jgi:hypothetical protein
MARNVTHIVHVGKGFLTLCHIHTDEFVAWPMDFAIPLGAFDHAIHGLRNLVDFAISSPWQVAPQLFFTSTVGVLSGKVLCVI